MSHPCSQPSELHASAAWSKHAFGGLTRTPCFRAQASPDSQPTNCFEEHSRAGAETWAIFGFSEVRGGAPVLGPPHAGSMASAASARRLWLFMEPRTRSGRESLQASGRCRATELGRQAAIGDDAGRQVVAIRVVETRNARRGLVGIRLTTGEAVRSREPRTATGENAAALIAINAAAAAGPATATSAATTTRAALAARGEVAGLSTTAARSASRRSGHGSRAGYARGAEAHVVS